MTTRLNRFYNHPGLGQGLSNLASIFAPPDPQMELAYSTIAKQNVERGGLESLYGMAADPNVDTAAFDRMGAVTGQWNPNQGFGARDMANAATLRGQDISSADSRYGTDVGASTARRGQDLTHSASVYGADQSRNASVVGHLSRALAPGDTRPDVDPLLEAMGLPGVGGAQGLPKPMSTDEFTATIMGDAYANPEFGPGMQQGAARNVASDFNVETIRGPDGVPTFVPRGGAVGQEAHVNQGGMPAKQIVQWIDPMTGGVGGRGVYDPTAGATTWEGGVEPPPNATVIGPGQPAGTLADLGPTTANMTESNRALADVAAGRSLLTELRRNLESKPGQYGVVGAAQMLAQDIRQAAGELSGALQSRGMDEAIALDEFGQMAGALANSQGYDPSFRELRAKMLELAYMNARLNNPSGEVSRYALERELDALSQGLLANDASLGAALNAFEDRINRSEVRARALQQAPGANLSTGAPALQVPAAPAAAPTPAAAPMRATNPQTGEIVEWNGTAWVPVR